MSANYLYFDIETTAHERISEFAEYQLPDLDSISAPSTYKDPEKIETYEVGARRKALLDAKEDYQKQIAKAPLNPDLCQIAAIAWAFGDGPIVSHIVGDLYDERQVLELFLTGFSENGGVSAGYNILGFDWPVILRRRFDLKMRLPDRARPNLARYRTYPTLDLMMVLANWNFRDVKSLKWVIKRFGIPNDLPDLEGSQVKDMDPETLKMYVENDVRLTRFLADRMRGIYF